MRQLLAAIVLGGALAVTASAAFAAKGDHGSPSTPPFSSVVLEGSVESGTLSGTGIQQTFLNQYRQENIGH